MSGTALWQVEVRRAEAGWWRWQIVNRKGDLVMSSESYPTEAGARVGAEAEHMALREAVLVR